MRTQHSFAVAVGALAFGVCGIQPLAAEEPGMQGHTPTSYCGGMETAAWEQCMQSHFGDASSSAGSGSSYGPADEPRGVLGRAGDERAAEEAIPASNAGEFQRGSNPANTFCDSQTAAREGCVSSFSTGGIQQGSGD